ncbi:MAG: ATP-binding protein [Muribaculaceae bacterium]|nr:ATP-binding protein [Muribaculaceae bacterium]
MIAEFKIRNFYSLKEEQTLSFIPTKDDTLEENYTQEVADGVRLLKIASIYGSNASGKTNVLHALDFFARMMVETSLKKSDEMGVVPFLLDGVSETESTSFEMSFYLNREKYILSLSLDKKVIHNESLVVYASAQPTMIYKRAYDAKGDVTVINFGAKSGLQKKSRETIEGNTISNRTVIAAFGMSNVKKTRLNLVYDFFSSRIAPAMLPTTSLLNYTKQNLRHSRSGKLKNFILRFLKASDFNISDITLHDKEEIGAFSQKTMAEKQELLFTHHTENGFKALDESLESRGTKRYLGLATILFDLLARGIILPIDEIESSIHYELLSYFIRVFLVNSKKQAQLLLTTHDINLLDEDFTRRDTIWFTDKNESGETQLLRLSSLGLHKTISVYNAYKQEKLVNLPFTESIYFDNEWCEDQE